MNIEKEYNRDDFLVFLKSFVPGFIKDVRSVGVSGLQVTKEIFYLGESVELGLTIFELTHSSSSDARVALAMDGFRVMKGSATYRALVIYRFEKGEDWRLSLMTASPVVSEKGKVGQLFSNPRRFSFFLGPNAKINTPYQFLVKQGAVKDFTDLQKRFSLEVVNKEFYSQIALLFTQLAGGKRTIGRKSIDAGSGLLSLPSTNDDTLDKEFTVRLIGRLVFCWFLKKKRSDKNIPLLPEELFSAKAVSENKGYYHGILEPLFFEVLNTPADNREKKYQSAPWTQIPFLNGGLFTPHHHDFYERGLSGISKYVNTLKVPDAWVKELFEIFETYNFTIDENTSVDVELSIEPEMLGRIFENLLAEINPETGETARKATGSYYTPRPIVEYMVDESLKQYLLTKTKLDENKIKSLLTYEDLALILTESEKESVLTALDAVKVIDPACGSGAFPMGILQKMLLILQKVDPESEWWLERKLSQIESKLLKKELGKKLKSENVNYVHKLGIIQGSIYGVDIQPIAVEISKLRFFLSLIVDEKVNDAKENRGIEPLPNLEFKFVCTNSLIGLPKKEKNPNELFETEDMQSINELKDLRDEYLRSYGIEKQKIQINFLKTQKKMVEFYWKQVLKPQADLSGSEKKIKKQDTPEFTRMLSNWDPFSDEPAGWFDSEWMFGIKDGFDIVIANPPYVSIKGIDWDKRRFFEGVFITAKGRFDLYVLFLELAEKLSNSSGFISFIIPGKFVNNLQFEVARKMLIEKGFVNVTFIDEKVFQEASVDNVIVFAGNNVSKNNSYEAYKFLSTGPRLLFSSTSDEIKRNRYIFTFQSNTTHNKILEKVEKDTIPLIDVCEVKDGIVAGEIKDELFLDALRDKDSKALLFGKDVNKYFISKPSKYVNYKPDEMMHIELSRKNGKRYGLWMRTPEIFERHKILTRKVGTKIVAALDSNNYYYEQTLHSTALLDKRFDIKYILALYNSNLFIFYYRNMNSQGGQIFPQIRISSLEKLPIKNICKNDQEPFVNLVTRIMNIPIEGKPAMKDVTKYQCEIDRLIYGLYGLTKKEVEIVENSVKE